MTRGAMAVLLLAFLSFGCESRATLSVPGVADAGVGETEVDDDAGALDSPVDAGVVDSGLEPVDAGEVDAGEVDAGLAAVDAGPLALTISPGQLVPAFDPAITHYELTEYSALSPMTLTVSGVPFARVDSTPVIGGQTLTLPADAITAQRSSIVVTVGATSYELSLRPADWPSFTVTSTDPTPGQIFLAPFEWATQRYGHFLVVLNERGEVVFYRRLPAYALDFKRQLEANAPGTPDAVEFALDGGAETFRLQFDDDTVYSYRVLKF